MAQKKESFFWTSYSDFMTSLFFVMLALFALVVVVLHNRVKATQRELDDIKTIQESTKDLSVDYFEYRDDYKKYVLKTAKPVRFNVGSADFKDIDSDTREELRRAGEEIQKFFREHSKNQYLLIIEGQASRDRYTYNYELSYQRALRLVRYWIEESHLDFGNNCEIQIAGSGDGVLRTNSIREATESENQRFLVHIIPKNIIEIGEN